MNGALTIGTLDGANVEIRDAVGPDNFFLFGLTAEQVERRKAAGYSSPSIYESNDELREGIDLIADGYFSNGDRDLFRPLIDSLLSNDGSCCSPTIRHTPTASRCGPRLRSGRLDQDVDSQRGPRRALFLRSLDS